MSYCRPASEAEYFEGFLPTLFDGLTVDQAILNIRNGNAYNHTQDDYWTDEQRERITAVVDEAREILLINGFIRLEISYMVMPEMYFALKYIVELDLTDDYLERFLPYLASNEDYERYMFCYERLEGSLEILEKILSAEEFYEVLTDVMYLGEMECNEKILNQAKLKIVDNKDRIIPKLETVFAKF